MTVFDEMAQDLFGDPNLASDAVYSPEIGPSLAVRIMGYAPDQEVGVFEVKARGSALQVQILVSSLPGIAEGATLSIGAGGPVPAGDYTVKAFRADAFGGRRTWVVDLRS